MPPGSIAPEAKAVSSGRSCSLMPGEILGTILDAVGNTPMVRLSRLASETRTPVVAKLEFLNPGGSIKDRIGLAMIEAAEQAGQLRPGATIVEPTSGNTGTGLAIAASLKGYRLVCVMPDKMSSEKIALLRAYGADVVVCPTAVPRESPQSYYSVVDRIEVVDDKEGFLMARRMTREEGILIGGSGGSAVVAALRVAFEIDDPRALIVVLLPDTGRNYLSKIYNEEWMRSNGFLEQFPMHSVGEVVSQRATQSRLPPFVGVQARDTVRAAIDAMQHYGISQLPVLEGAGDGADTRMVGSIQERTLLDRIYRDPTLVDSA